MPASRFFAALCFCAYFLRVPSAEAAPLRTAPTEALMLALDSAAHLTAPQRPAVRVAVGQYIAELAQLRSQHFASAAAASAAYTMVELRYYRALEQVLSSQQLAACQRLSVPAPQDIASRP